MQPLETNGFLDSDIQQTITGFRKRYSEWFGLSDEVNRYCHQLMHNLDVHSGDMEEVIVATLYLRSMEIFQGAIILAERGLTAPAKMLARCIFDSTFPLCAISNDTNGRYYKEYIQNDLINRKKSTNKYKKLSNADEKHIPELEKLESEISHEIDKEDIKERKTIYWAEQAGLTNWYHSVYSTLSNSVTRVSEIWSNI